MADHHDYLALDWVRGEIQETLNQAQQTLESYVENPADSSRMRFCQTYLHQVHGTLKMVEFYGAALLAEEMEQLANALLNGRVVSEADAQETLMRAILQLPPYLDRIQVGRHDLPWVLLPLLNDMRAVRGEQLLSETSLFKPDLSQLEQPGDDVPARQDGSFPQLARKLRQMYQLALLGVLRDAELPKQFDYLMRVLARLEKLSGNAAMAPIWGIAAALVEGLRDQGIELSVAVKMMLGQLDRQLRELVNGGAQQLDTTPPTELAKNLLYYVAKSTLLTPRIAAVRERFQLDDALPSDDLISAERERMSGPDQSTMSSVVQALSDELGKVKAALERFSQEGSGDMSLLEEEVGALKQVSDTLAVLGLGQVRDAVETQLERLNGFLSGSAEVAQDALQEVASELLQVESRLAGLAQGGAYDADSKQTPEQVVHARDAVLRECHADLEDAKDGIVEFIASQWDKQHLQSVPAQLTAVRGGLELVHLQRPAEILRQCANYIEAQLLPEEADKPDWRSMDTLADAITSVEYYLERLADDPTTRDDILLIARDSVSSLGYSIADEDFSVAEDEPAVEEIEERTAVADDLTVELDGSVATEASADMATDSEEVALDDLVADLQSPVEDIEAAPLVLDEEEDKPAEEALGDSSPAVAESESLSAADEAPDEDDLIDDEIIEIFVEEAGEVLEALNEYFPRWAANTSDEEALTEFRRAFHTLKGSGRMVGASTVGELAWSIENMLNRVIDKTIEPTSVLIDLVRQVHGILPALVEDFSQRRQPSVEVQPLMTAADTLADGGSIDALPGISPEDGQQAEAVAEEEQAATSTAEAAEEETLLDVFIAEADSNLSELSDWLDSLDGDLSEHPLDDLVHRCLHTIKGSARMAGVEAMAELAEPAEKCVKEMINLSIAADIAFLTLLRQSHQLLQQAQLALLQQQEVGEHLPGAEALVAQFEECRQQLGRDTGDSINRQLLSVFLSEGMDIILDAEGLLERWAQNPEQDEELVALADELKLLSGSAQTAGLFKVYEMSALLAECYQALSLHRRHPDDDFIAHARAGQEALVNMMDCLAAGQTIQAGLDIKVRLQAWLDQGEAAVSAEADSDNEGDEAADDTEGDSIAPLALATEEADVPEEITFELPAAAGADEHDDAVSVESQQTPPAAAELDTEAASSAASREDAGPAERLEDEELGSIFLEEAEETLEEAQQQLDSWQDAGDDSQVAVLQRHLHTLKGGARMAGVGHVGDLAHELEFLYEEIALGQRQADASLFTVLQRSHDQLAAMIETLRAGAPVYAATELLAAIAAARATQEDVIDAPLPAADSDVAAEPPETGTADVETAAIVMPDDLSSADEADSGDQPQVTSDEQSTAGVATPFEPAESLAEPEVDALPPQDVNGADLPAAAASQVERDPELTAIFLEEAEELMEAVGESLESWMEAPDNLDEVQTLQRYLHTLKGGARMAEVPELGNLGHELENLYEGLAQKRFAPNQTLFDLLYRCHDRLTAMVEGIKQGEALQEAQELIELIHAYEKDPDGLELPAENQPTAQPQAVDVAVQGEQAATAETAADVEPLVLPDDVDRDILDIFLEESSDIGESLDAALQAWRQAPDDEQPLDDIKRALHTLKGGARLAGLVSIGDSCHDAETQVEQLSGSPDDAFFDDLQARQDAIGKQLESVRAALIDHSSQADEQTQLPATVDETPTVAAVPAEQPTNQPITTPQARQQKQQDANQPQEMVRIGADVLESLVNLAGETSINRGRVEQGVSGFVNHLSEMDNTVERLYEQLRRLDIETEAQIMSNYKQGVESGEYGEDFDPLEMDQYSELHQITKQLSESASDLLDLKNTLIDGTRDTETLLLQQSRVNTELQEKLMRTRMVPFTRLVPRLRRIVRQVSGELYKQVDFNVINPEGELDRTLMERIVAPLEHMLRNAIDHGVETPEKRLAAGKPEKGSVTLEMGRDGGDIYMVLSDDGGGIDTEAVRKKAIEKGLIDADSLLTDQEVQQFIFNAGFSTAKAVTQVSGRGVGMDVVASDIKQMGGSVSIDSEFGKGTRFVVRLPFTLAMNRALLVRAGEDAYAVPLTQVEGIVRISPYELEAYLGDDAEGYTYAGQHYTLDYLGQYVHGVARPNLEGITAPLPVLLLHSQEHQVALVVDGLIGSREVVVKSVGPQLSTVAGLSGATILGDGSVVIILDIHSLIRAAFLERSAIASGQAQPEELQPERIEDVDQGLPLVMVTDDSVTVRKVTTRLLERHGFEVVTAKDGMDAVAKLEDHKPDLMLLDIEMPRMDGYEVASHMRHDSRFEKVPIIMITSRTGDKHRERAFDIGVNSYLGKPFQESELLVTIRELLALEA